MYPQANNNLDGHRMGLDMDSYQALVHWSVGRGSVVEIRIGQSVLMRMLI